MRPVEPFPLLSPPLGSFSAIAGDDAIHAGPAHGLLTRLLAVRCAPGPEDGAGLESGLLEVLGYRLRGGEMNTDGAVFFGPFR
jgi:hypothetical protein